MKTYKDLVADCLPYISELYPWDLEEELEQDSNIILIDINEPYEYALAHIPDSINVPRGILEAACDYGYDETIPELAGARTNSFVIICRSGNRSALAAFTMKNMGFTSIRSLKTGLRGWNDNEGPLVDAQNKLIDPDIADNYFTTRLRPEQIKPK